MYDMILHFGRRGREGLRKMSKSTFSIKVSSSGRRFVTITHNESNKNHDGSDGIEKEQMMFEQNDKLCPVSSYERYVALLNPKLDTFWQTPKPKVSTSDECWYKNSPMGVNTLQDFMKNLSTAAKLSKDYTNHCIRATVCSALDQAGVEREDIKLITGHKNSRSLDSYIKPTVAKREKLSSTVFQYGSSTSTSTQAADSVDMSL